MKIRVVYIMLFFSLSMGVFAQGGHIKIFGNVRDASDYPLDLVAVWVKNTLIGTYTNEQGYYSLSVAPSDSITLIFICLGYHEAACVIPNATQDIRVNVQMNATALNLAGVTITAVQPRNDLTMETIDANRLKILPDPSG